MGEEIRAVRGRRMVRLDVQAGRENVGREKVLLVTSIELVDFSLGEE